MELKKRMVCGGKAILFGKNEKRKRKNEKRKRKKRINIFSVIII